MHAYILSDRVSDRVREREREINTIDDHNTKFKL